MIVSMLVLPITFKLEETNDGTLGVEKIRGHSGSGMWEELCLDFTGETLTVIAYSMIFDNGVQGQADVDPDNWTFFIDDIAQVGDLRFCRVPSPVDACQMLAVGVCATGKVGQLRCGLIDDHHRV